MMARWVTYGGYTFDADLVRGIWRGGSGSGLFVKIHFDDGGSWHRWFFDTVEERDIAADKIESMIKGESNGGKYGLMLGLLGAALLFKFGGGR
jgi:hypothetical protein